MGKNRIVLVSVFSNTALIIIKIVAGILMGSVAVVSEAVHSCVDLLAASVALLAVSRSDKPADEGHPFGHGKFENISGFSEALLIFLAAGVIIYGAVRKLIHPPGAIERLEWGIVVMAFSTVINTGVSLFLFRSAKKTGSIAIEADALHLGIDVFASLGVMAGLVVIRFTHLVWLDPLIAIVVAGLILRASIDLTVRSIADLADQSLPDTEINTIKSLFSGYPEIVSYHKLRTRKSGSRREIDVHIRIDKETPISSAHELCDDVEEAIMTALPGANVTIHVEPVEE